MTIGRADIVPCPGMSNPYEHSMRDYCWTCAPYWEAVPICPTHKSKLRTTESRVVGVIKGYCRDCRKHYDYSHIWEAKGVT